MTCSIGFLHALPLYLLIISAFFLRFDAKKALQIGLRDAHKHPSPNGGYAEAPVAGALHIRLGGYNQYFKKMTFREYMGDPIEKLNRNHITRTIYMMYFYDYTNDHN